jgi:DNA-binding PadR family transcriptional regulator
MMDLSEMDISLPLKPQVLHILLALAGEDRHGYAIMQTVREQSGGTVPLRTGSFYRHLATLIDAGLVDEAPARREHDDPRRGAYYRLTAEGRRLLQAEKQRLVALVAAFPRGTGAPRKGRA